MNRFYCTDKSNLARETYYVRVFSAKKGFNILNMDSIMERLHFSFHKGSEDFADCYDKAFVSEDELKSLTIALRGYKEYIAVKYCKQKYARGTRYREDFIGDSKKMYYRCAYCGKRIDRRHLVVDHIFPVQKMMDSEQTRRHARMFGIHETNAIRNLAPACYECNKAKGSKTGFWVIRGLLGRCGGRRIITAFEIVLAIFGLLFMIAVFNAGNLAEIFGFGRMLF